MTPGARSARASAVSGARRSRSSSSPTRTATVETALLSRNRSLRAALTECQGASPDCAATEAAVVNETVGSVIAHAETLRR